MKIAIGPSSFGVADPKPVEMLRDKGFEVIDNPFKRRLTEKEIIQQLQGAVGLIAGLEPLNERVLSSCPDLKAIARVGIGMDNVDQKACQKHGVKVSNTPNGPTNAVAEFVLGALLSIGRNIVSGNEALHNKKWQKEIGFSLTGLKVLVVGMGRIGTKTTEVLSSLGCECKGYDPAIESRDFQNLEEGLKWAEVITLHAAGNEEIIGFKEITAMKNGVIILNSARGGLINEEALFKGLKSGKIRATWMDVFPYEPYDGKLTELSNCIMTPHTSTYTRQCRLSMETEAVKNLLKDLDSF